MAEKPEEFILIKKIKKGGGHGHHGGAWKVAYADFVTAMMAFFLVMWILGLSPESRDVMSSFFREPGVFDIKTGKALPIGMSSSSPARYTLTKDESYRDNFKRSPSASIQETLEALPPDERQKLVTAIEDSVAAARSLEIKGGELERQIENVVDQNAELQDLSDAIDINLTEEGLRVELLENRESVFYEVGSSSLTGNARTLLQSLAQEIGRLPNFVQVEGHTDSRPFGANSNITNWELSADRANSARRALERYGLWEGQISQVTGYADRKLRNTENPFDVANRRISILIEFLKTDNFIEDNSQ